MINFLFLLFSALALLGNIIVILSNNIVNSAIAMILTFLATAGIFILLDAFFLAVIEILIYAGAVMVLFLFIIMLLDIEKKSNFFLKKIYSVTSIIFLILFTTFLLILFISNWSFYPLELKNISITEMPINNEYSNSLTQSLKSYGFNLFTLYMLPFQVVGFLLLISTLGVVIISKNNYKNDLKM